MTRRVNSIALAVVLAAGIVVADAQTSPPGQPEPSQRILVENLPLNGSGLSAGPLDFTHIAVTDKRGRCKIHHQPLHRGLVPVSYGLAPPPPGVPLSERITRAPNIRQMIAYGCLVTREIIESRPPATVLYCKKCEEVARKLYDFTPHTPERVPGW